MAKAISRLTALKVSRLKVSGMHPDGGGLYLQISRGGTKSWIYRYMLRGRAREMGLGPLSTVSLAEARARAAEARKMRADGVDPIESRKAHRDSARIEAAKATTFAECAAHYLKAHSAGWRNAKHAAQWTATLSRYVEPMIGGLPVQAIDISLVLKVLEPIWNIRPETASRVRGRMEVVLDWATARGYRRGENPARWRGHLDKLLPPRARIRKVRHHPALPYSSISEFMHKLRGHNGSAARALEFAILTAARTGEVIGAQWPEFDLNTRAWTVPAERIKGGRMHKVPLSTPAVALIERVNSTRLLGSAFVFPGSKLNKPLSNMAMLKLLERLGHADVTVHGFRSTFRDWAAERTNYPREVAEMALAHVVSDKVESAYRRGDLFEKRRRLMEEWGRYCSARIQSGKIVSLASANLTAENQ